MVVSHGKPDTELLRIAMENIGKTEEVKKDAA